MRQIMHNLATRLNPFAIWFMFLWLMLTAVGRERMFRDPGTLWHTVVGQRMIDRGELIRTDPFSFTFENRPWIAQQWLAECAMALLHRIAALDGLLLLATTLLAATYASIAARLMARGLSVVGTMLVVALMLGASSYHFHARPHIATIAFSAWVFSLLCDVEAGRASVRRLWFLPAAIAIWTNMHGGALGGLVTILSVLGGWILVMLVIAPRSTRGCGMLIGVGLVTLASIMVNPYGLEMPRVWLSLMTSKVLPQIMHEHGPLVPGSPEGWLVLVFAALYVIVLLDSRREMLRVTWLVPLLWLILTVSRIRHGPIFAILAAITIAEMLPYSNLLKRLRDAGSLVTSKAALSAGSTRSGRWVVIVVFGLALTIQALGAPVPIIGSNWARLSPAYWPVEACEAMRKIIPDSRNAKIFNQMTFGGYLIYAVPQARLFIDDRCELYGDRFLLHYDAISRDPERIDAEASRWQVEMALVATRSKLAAHLGGSDKWEPVHEDETASLFRVRPAHSRTSIGPSENSPPKSP